MNKIILFAKSSSRDDPYTVTFSKSDSGTLSVWCDCPAGIYGKLCKHKLLLSSNDASMLYDDYQVAELKKAHQWVNDAGLIDIINEASSIEKEIEDTKKLLKKMKSKIARLMMDGVK